MKKIAFILSFLLVFSLIGCSEKTQNTIKDTIKYESSYIKAFYVDYSNYEKPGNEDIEFSAEEVANILEILNNSEWHESVTKCIRNRVLLLEGNTLYYTFESGAVNDEANYRYTYLSEDDRAYLNSLILKKIEYKSTVVRVQSVDGGFASEPEELELEDSEKILSIWNSGEWMAGVYGGNQFYAFSLSDGKSIYYASGYFYDVENKRYLSPTQDQREYINALLNQIYK